MTKHKDLEQLPAAFGLRLREQRIEARLSQEALAYAAGVDRTLVGKVERGQGNLTLISLVKIARGLETTPSELLDGIW